MLLFALPGGLGMVFMGLYLLIVSALSFEAVRMSNAQQITVVQMLVSVLLVWGLPVIGPLGIFLFLRKPQAA